MQAVFLADGKWIMSTGEDLTVRFWSRKTGHPLRPPSASAELDSS